MFFLLFVQCIFVPYTAVYWMCLLHWPYVLKNRTKYRLEYAINGK